MNPDTQNLSLRCKAHENSLPSSEQHPHAVQRLSFQHLHHQLPYQSILQEDNVSQTSQVRLINCQPINSTGCFGDRENFEEASNLTVAGIVQKRKLHASSLTMHQNNLLHFFSTSTENIYASDVLTFWIISYHSERCSMKCTDISSPCDKLGCSSASARRSWDKSRSGCRQSCWNHDDTYHNYNVESTVRSTTDSDIAM